MWLEGVPQLKKSELHLSGSATITERAIYFAYENIMNLKNIFIHIT